MATEVLRILVPISETDADANISSGVFTQVDQLEQNSGKDVDRMSSVQNEWVNAPGSFIEFGLPDLPAGAVTINTIELVVRAVKGGTFENDTIQWLWSINGTGLDGIFNSLLWDQTDGAALETRRTGNINLTATVANVNAMTVRVSNTIFSQTKGPDGMFHQWSFVNVIVNYNGRADNLPYLRDRMSPILRM